MTYTEARVALDDARVEARQASRHEDSVAGLERREAELAEWARIAQLLDALPDRRTYDPGADPVARAEEKARLREEADVRQEREQEMRLAARGGVLMELAEDGRLHTIAPEAGDAQVRELLAGRGHRCLRAVDDWLGRALAERSGCYARAGAREAEALPATVCARAALYTALARLGARDLGISGVGAGESSCVGRLADADPEAVYGLVRRLAAASGPRR